MSNSFSISEYLFIDSRLLASEFIFARKRFINMDNIYYGFKKNLFERFIYQRSLTIKKVSLIYKLSSISFVISLFLGEIYFLIINLFSLMLIVIYLDQFKAKTLTSKI